jgi:hypothetical protein
VTAKLLTTILLALTALSGCGPSMPTDAIDALNGADTYELLSLDPGNHEAPPANQFHTWQVLGRVLIDDAATRARLNDALRAGASEKVDPAACFEPRHGIRVTHAGQTTDFVICFGCGQAYVLTTGKKDEEFLVSHSPRAVFDEVLKSKSVLLPTD